MWRALLFRKRNSFLHQLSILSCTVVSQRLILTSTIGISTTISNVNLDLSPNNNCLHFQEISYHSPATCIRVLYTWQNISLKEKITFKYAGRVFGFQGLKFDVCPSLYEENLDPSKYKCHSEYVLDCASNKVQEVWDRLSAEGNQPDIIIGADTVVSMDGRLYGKPKDEEKAVEMLKE